MGVPGSGKSTFARALAARLAVRYVELDEIHHRADWTPLDREEFRRQVDEIAQTDAWVIDGNYDAVCDLVWERADTVVWIDLPRATIMRRITARTLKRTLTREQLWNGNREPLSNLYSLAPEKNVIVWAWMKHPVYQRHYAAAMTDPHWAHITFVRLRSPDEVSGFLSAPA